MGVKYSVEPLIKDEDIIDTIILMKEIPMYNLDFWCIENYPLFIFGVYRSQSISSTHQNTKTAIPSGEGFDSTAARHTVFAAST